MVTKDQTAFSERERQALRLLLAGHDANSIANTLGLAVHTVNDRLRDARRKMGTSSSREAARRFAELDGDPNFVRAKEIGDVGTAFQSERAGEPASPRSPGHRLAWLAGGMLIMSLIIAAVALSTISMRNDAQAAAQSDSVAAPTPVETEESSDARSWVELLDRGQWDESWKAAGTAFKAQLTSAQWAATLRSVRQPLGQATSRTLQNVVRTTTLPGAPEGDYQVVQFQTRFANKPDAIETVVVSHEPTGWRVNGYFVR